MFQKYLEFCVKNSKLLVNTLIARWWDVCLILAVWEGTGRQDSKQGVSLMTNKNVNIMEENDQTFFGDQLIGTQLIRKMFVPFIGGEESATAQLRLKEKLKPEVKDEVVCWR